MSAERLEFSQVIEGLFVRGLKGRVDDALRAQLKGAGIDLSNSLLPAYPSAVFAKGVELAAKHLHPDLPYERAVNQLGRAFFRGYVGTLVGAAMFQVMKLIGPRRTLQRMQRNFRTGTNYVTTRFVALGPTEVDLWFNEVNGLPTFYQGVMEEGAGLIGATNVSVIHRPDPAGGTWFHVKWAE